MATGAALLIFLAAGAAWVALRPEAKDHSGDLRRFLVPAPAGSILLPHNPFSDPSPEPGSGIISSVSEIWNDRDGRHPVVVTLDRYGSVTAARQASTEQIKSLPDRYGGNIAEAPVPGVPGAMSFDVGPVTVLGTRGDVTFTITASLPTDAPDRITAVDRIAAAQYDLL